MKYSDIKVGKTLISPANTFWKVIKKYGSDMWLIKKGKIVCILKGGQVRRDWALKQETKTRMEQEDR